MRLFTPIFIFLALGIRISEQSLYAQNLNFTHYTVESGLQLPSNEVYGIVFDKNHVLWATTDRGVWRYDGYTGRQFTVRDGLKENTNLRIFSDSTGMIWVSSINNYLYQISGDVVRKYPMSDSIHQLGSASQFIQQVTPLADGSIYLSFNRPGLYHFKPGEKPVQITSHLLNQGKASLGIRYRPDEYYWDMFNYNYDGEHSAIRKDAGSGWTYLTYPFEDPKNHYRHDLCPIGPDEYICSCTNRVFYIRNGQIVGERALNAEINDVYADRNGNFWVGTENEGVYRFLNRDLGSDPLRYLENESVSGINQDQEGNYWFSTTTNGIYQASTLEIDVYRIPAISAPDQVITAMVGDEKHIYLGTQTGLVLKGTELPNHKFRFTEFRIPVTSGSIRKLILTPENHLIIFNNIVQEIDTSGRYCGVRKLEFYPFAYVRRPNGMWMVSFTSNIYFIMNGKVLRVWDQETIKKTFPHEKILLTDINRVRCMYLDSTGLLWLGSQKSGLFTSRDSINYHWAGKDTLFGKRISDICQVGSKMWVSVADYGIVVIKPDSSYIRITQNDGLSSDIIDLLYPENDSVVWAGTNNGLNRIVIPKDSLKRIQITHFTMREGLPSNRIYQIIKHGKNIWIATTQGAVQLDPLFAQPPDLHPDLQTGPLLVNDLPRPLVKDMVLGRRENTLVFNFKSVSYRKPNPIRYRYKLTGADDEYIESDGTQVRYADLGHGNYTFCINSSYNGNFDPATEKKFTIYIRPYWYETNLFLILAGFTLLALIYFFVNYILSINRNREAQKRQLMQAEKRSLLSQMNPHFIFNSLNSIQHFIVQHDEMQANNYLTNFSGLIRRILDNSKKNLIPLHEEISALTLYLSMEKLRFENEFEYSIVKDVHIDYNETMIPPMLLQPFVENAIWHGLLPMKTKGELTITFTDLDDFFQCSIEDNGIGREKAMTLKGKKGGHNSSGIRNVEERIELLNHLNKKKIRLIIADLKNPDGIPAGTLVEVSLPYDLKI